jgi:hypothetical protein
VNKHFNKLDRSIKIEKMKEKVIHFIKWIFGMKPEVANEKMN